MNHIILFIKALFSLGKKEVKKAPMVMPYYVSDKRQIVGRTTPLFIDDGLDAQSVTSNFKTEDEVVNWLLNDKEFVKMLFQQIFSPPCDVCFYAGVKEPITTKGVMPGDIDILLHEKGKEESAVGIECKVVNLESFPDQMPKINKISRVKKKGVKQGNSYLQLGFNRVFLMVIILDDGRHYKNPNFFFREAPRHYLDSLFGFEKNTKLHDAIGIIYVKVNQFTSNHINQTKKISVGIWREATPNLQTEKFTEDIKIVRQSLDLE